MKLLACHIDNFGKLSNINIDFKDGVNIINQPNGWGKSTLAAFLKAMLYGFDNRKAPGAYDKERNIYDPWQSGPFGGTLDFEVDGKGYRVSRSFGKSEKADVFHLYNLKTLLESSDYTSNLGEELFDLDSASFKRTIFVSQADCASEGTDGINAKLGNIAENTNDMNNFETATARLKDAMNRLSPSRATGSIKRREGLITETEIELRKYESAYETAAVLQARIDEKEEQKAELTELRREYASALAIASEDSRLQALKETFEHLLADVDEKEATYNRLRDSFVGEIPTDEDIAPFISKATEIESLITLEQNLSLTPEENSRYAEVRNRFTDVDLTEEMVDGQQEKVAKLISLENEKNALDLKLEELLARKKEEFDDNPLPDEHEKSKLVPAGIVFTILGLLAAGSGVYLFMNMLFSLGQLPIYGLFWLGFIVFVIGLIMIICGAWNNVKAREELEFKHLRRDEELKKKDEPIGETRSALEDINESIDILKTDVEGFFAGYGIEGEDIDYQKEIFNLKDSYVDYNRYGSKVADIEKTCNKRAVLEYELQEFGKKYGIEFNGDYATKITELRNRANEFNLAASNFEAVTKRAQEFTENNDLESMLMETRSPYSLDEINNMISNIDGSLEEVRDVIETYKRQLDDMSEQLEKREESETKLANYRLLQQEEQNKYNTIALTAEFLAQAKESFTTRYMTPITEGFAKYYNTLITEEDAEWKVDANMAVTMYEQGEYRDTETLSAGFQDLIGVCMRFALADAMYPGEKPFLILDDPFVNLDEEKLERGHEVLKMLEKDYQVIYFTCHRSREYM